MINPLSIITDKKVGLVLGSGGAKGIAHISVMEYLKGMGIPIHMISGSSAGALAGALYCTDVLEKFKKDLISLTDKEKRHFFDFVFPRSGLIAGEGVVDFIEQYIPASLKIEELSIPLGIVATEYYNGKSVVFRKGSIIDALRSSMSIPGVFVPVRYKGTFLLDGGVANPLPINVVKRMGADVTIAVNLHPKLSKKEYKLSVSSKDCRFNRVIDSSDLEKIKTVGSSSIIKEKSLFTSIESIFGVGNEKIKKQNKAPNIIEVMSQSIDIMGFVNTMLILKYNSPTVLIEPQLFDTKMMEISGIAEKLTAGYEAAVKVRGKLKRKVKIWF